MTGPWIMKAGIELAERGLAPDVLVRHGIRRLCRRRLRDLEGSGADPSSALLAQMRSGPIAPLPERANEQHYELPESFFGLVLGRHRKYSGCYWPAGTRDLDHAERLALVETCVRADLRDGMEILELGCGWGSLSLWMARCFPGSRVTAVSNSASQRRFIEGEAARQGLENVHVVTADMNDFDPAARFDRVVSVEMFEHMRNYRELLRRVAGWLEPEGKAFVHVFCHRRYAYEFREDGDADWMGRHFFTAGLMPSADLLSRFDEHLRVTRQWHWNGRHYQRTAEAWLSNLDRRRREAMPILSGVYGPAEAARWFHRWRIFFLACAELFGQREGREWFVTHCLLEPVPAGVAAPVATGR